MSMFKAAEKTYDFVSRMFVIFLFAVLLVGYALNVVAFVSSDFEAPFKSEAIHCIGIFVPPIGCITGYIDFGK